MRGLLTVLTAIAVFSLLGGLVAKGLLTLSWAASQPPVAPSGPPPAS